MKKVIFMLFCLLIGVFAEAKQWPSDALSQLKRNQGIQVDCNYLSSMLGRDMSYEYPQKLLQAYKSSYPDYAKFEDFTVKYRSTADPIRISMLKNYVRNCTFSNVWRILESNSPVVARLRNESPSKYNRLQSITINKLQSQFGSVAAFTEAMCVRPKETSSAIERITAEAANQINSGSSSYPTSSNKTTLPSNRITTESHIWTALSIEVTNGKTYVHKNVTSRADETWICSSTDEFIEDAETGRKYYLTSSTIPMYPQQKILVRTSNHSFTETYPALPSNVRYINISSGYQYYVKNVRIR